MMTNNTTAAIELDIYDLGYRADQQDANDPVTLWARGDTSRSNGSFTGATALDPTVWNTSPMASIDFKKFIRVQGIKRVLIPAGGFHKHTGFMTIKKWVPYGRIQATTDTLFAGYTHFVMCVGRGFPARTAGDNPVNSTAPPEITISENFDVKYRLCNFMKSFYDVNHTMDTTPDNTTQIHGVLQANTLVSTVDPQG